MNLKNFIRDVPDFPKEGILFRDITPLLGDKEAFSYAVTELTQIIEKLKPDAIVAIESRGFVFGAPVAYELGVPFIPVRKPGKLPFKVVSIEYELEYSSGTLEMHADAVIKGNRVVIVDDLLATGGTASGAVKLIECCGGIVAGFVFLVEIEALNGRKELRAPVHTLLKY